MQHSLLMIRIISVNLACVGQPAINITKPNLTPVILTPFYASYVSNLDIYKSIYYSIYPTSLGIQAM